MCKQRHQIITRYYQMDYRPSHCLFDYRPNPSLRVVGICLGPLNTSWGFMDLYDVCRLTAISGTSGQKGEQQNGTPKTNRSRGSILCQFGLSQNPTALIIQFASYHSWNLHINDAIYPPWDVCGWENIIIWLLKLGGRRRRVGVRGIKLIPLSNWEINWGFTFSLVDDKEGLLYWNNSS